MWVKMPVKRDYYCHIFFAAPLFLYCIVLWNVKNGVAFHILSLIMLEGIEANKWIKSSGYSYVTEINPIVQWILDYYVIFRNFFDP